MRLGLRRFGDRGRATIAVVLVAMFVAAFAAPIGSRSAVAQDGLTIQTRVQILHASPGLGKVEVHINYEEVLDEFEYGDVSDWGEFGPSRDNIDEIADLIPRGSAAAFILLEHLWAIGLKEAVRNADGLVMAHGWVTPASLIAMGQDFADEVDNV